MRKSFTSLILLLAVAYGFAQAPQKMSYQCVVRNSSGLLVAGKSIGLRISILQGSTSGNVVYQETYNPNPQTNENGLVALEIGGGEALSGIFSDIDWASGTYFLKTETDPTGGTNYTISGTSQLLSVPYALHAKTADNGFSGNYDDLSDKPVITRETTDEFLAVTDQTTFTLGHIPSETGNLKMFINGVRISNSACSNSGVTLTYVPANNGSYVLTAGDRIQFDYSY